MRLAAAPARACRLVSCATESSLFKMGRLTVCPFRAELNPARSHYFVLAIARNSIPPDREYEIVRASGPANWVGGYVRDGARHPAATQSHASGLHRDLVKPVGLGGQGGALHSGLGGCENGKQQRLNRRTG